MDMLRGLGLGAGIGSWAWVAADQEVHAAASPEEPQQQTPNADRDKTRRTVLQEQREAMELMALKKRNRQRKRLQDEQDRAWKCKAYSKLFGPADFAVNDPLDGVRTGVRLVNGSRKHHWEVGVNTNVGAKDEKKNKQTTISSVVVGPIGQFVSVVRPDGGLFGRVVLKGRPFGLYMPKFHFNLSEQGDQIGVDHGLSGRDYSVETSCMVRPDHGMMEVSTSYAQTLSISPVIAAGCQFSHAVAPGGMRTFLNYRARTWIGAHFVGVEAASGQYTLAYGGKVKLDEDSSVSVGAHLIYNTHQNTEAFSLAAKVKTGRIKTIYQWLGSSVMMHTRMPSPLGGLQFSTTVDLEKQDLTWGISLSLGFPFFF